MLRRGFQPLGLVHSHFIKNSFTKASGNKSLSSVVKQFNQKRSYSTNNKNNSSHEEHGKQQKVEDEYDGIGDELPEPPLRDVILARIAGASAMFWFLYKMREEGLIIFGLERPHWEHAFDDSDSDRDDEYWDNAFQDDEETLDLTVDIKWRVPLDIKEKVGLKETKISFNTHRELDTLMCNILSKIPNFQEAYEEDYMLLKSFDRAMWLRSFRNPQDVTYQAISKSEYLRLSGNEKDDDLGVFGGDDDDEGDDNSGTGCPFGHPEARSFTPDWW